MRIHHIGITVKNLENSVSFYKDALGFVEVNRFTKPDWDGQAAILELNGMQLEIFEFESPIDMKDDPEDLHVIGIKHIGVQVDSVKEKHLELVSKNVDINEPKKGTTCAWYCFLRDPDGISIELYEPK